MRPDTLGHFIGQTACFPVDHGAIIYEARRKRLYSLNAAAAFVWHAVKDGMSDTDAIAALAARYELEGGTAEDWFRSALDSFSAIAEEASDEKDEARPAFRPRPWLDAPAASYAVLGQPVHVSAPPSAIAALDTMLGQLKIDGGGTVEDNDLWISVTRIDDQFLVESGGDPSTMETLGTLVADIERRIVQDAVPRSGHFLSFHAALLGDQRQAMLLAAPSGSGKTTLAVALAAGGWTLLSDELGLIDRDLRWRGLSLRPCIKSENEARIAQMFPAITAVPEHERFGRRVKFLPVAMGLGSVCPTLVVFPKFAAGSPTTVAVVDPASGLERLLGQCVYVPPGFGEADVGRLLHWHRAVDYVEVTFGDVADAVAQVEHFCRSKRSG